MKKVKKIAFILIGVFAVLFLISVAKNRAPGKSQESKKSETPKQEKSVKPIKDSVSNKSANQIIIGIEYAAPGVGKSFGELGVPAVKYYPDQVTWDEMQSAAGAAINFNEMDRYVEEYQNAGFKELTIILRSKSNWASKNPISNFTPKSEYFDDYKNWVSSVVERYDFDGNRDMPGLKNPVKYFGIGSEFSSFEPELADDYIKILESAYNAAHSVSDEVFIMPAGLLVTTAFKNYPKSNEYDAAFRVTDKKIMYHSLPDIRKILDRPDIFDSIDFHALGDPYEIEETVEWLDYEMDKRGYKKPIVIGDSATTPFIAWGPATTCVGSPSKLGVIVPPAKEEDRCRLAEYFKKLVDGDENAARWTQKFSAEDIAKKVIIAAEQNIALINTAFMEDLTPLKAKIIQAGAGTSPWGGMTLTTYNFLNQKRTIQEFRAPFYALKQLVGYLNGYDSVERIIQNDENIRLYKFLKDDKPFWITWFDPVKVILPGEETPQTKLVLETGKKSVRVEELITVFGKTKGDRRTLETKNGVLELAITPTPVFIFND